MVGISWRSFIAQWRRVKILRRFGIVDTLEIELSTSETQVLNRQPSQECATVLERLLDDMQVRLNEDDRKFKESLAGASPAEKAKLFKGRLQFNPLDKTAIEGLDNPMQKEVLLACIQDNLNYVAWRVENLGPSGDLEDEEDDEDEAALEEARRRNSRAVHVNEILNFLVNKSHEFSHDEILFLIDSASSEFEDENTGLPLSKIIQVIETYIKKHGRDSQIDQKLPIVLQALNKYGYKASYKKMVATVKSLSGSK